MQQRTLWSKMAGWIKPGGRGTSSPSLGLGPMDGEPDADVGGDAPPAGAQAGSSVGLSKWRRPDPAMEKLQEGHAKVIELIDSIQQHQQRQESQAAEISDTLTRMGQTLEQLDGSGQEQAKRLAEIADALRVGNERAGRWERFVTELPQLAQSQREALATVATQMEAAGEREDRMAGSLDSFRQAVGALGDATTSSSVAIKNLQITELENHDRVASLMREQNKRFTMLFIVTLVLVLVAIVTGMVALFKG